MMQMVMVSLISLTRNQTPAGAPVDTHGVSRDTDGDGVPDCKDKELITPTSVSQLMLMVLVNVLSMS